MFGKSAVSFKVIVDQHYITIETLQAFDILLSFLGVQFDCGNLAKQANFKSVLKDMNA